MKLRLTQLFILCLMSFTASAGLVTFTVDMSCYTGDQPLNEVYVSGDWDGWCGNCSPLNDNGDGTWSGTFDIPDGFHEFKFQVNQWADQESLTAGSACTMTTDVFTNRTINVTDGLTYTVAWNSCDGECAAPPEEPVDVTFIVDMSCYTGDLSPGATLNGTFNGWCGDCTALTDNGDGTWSATVPLLPGDYEFKFTVGAWVDQEVFAGGEDCTLTTDGFTNRFITVPATGLTVMYGWNSCGADCDGGAPPVEPVDVTFIIDMSCYTGDLSPGATLNGTFNGWCGDCTALTDNGDGTWSTTIALDPGDYEFKFSVGAWVDQEVFAGGEDCTLTTDGFTNRFITVPAAGLTVMTGWNTCDEVCPVSLPIDLVSFEVRKNGKDAQLEWRTQSDDAGNTFVIEYSRDAVDFKEIGTIQGTSGRDVNNYSFMHYLLANGENYYRLKNIDRDQTITFSDLRSLEVDVARKFNINPTVSSTDVNIQLDDAQLEGVFYIYNILGEQVFEQNIIDTNFSVDVSVFPVGQYIGVVQKGNEQVIQKFIKTN